MLMPPRVEANFVAKVAKRRDWVMRPYHAPCTSLVAGEHGAQFCLASCYGHGIGCATQLFCRPGSWLWKRKIKQAEKPSWHHRIWWKSLLSFLHVPSYNMVILGTRHYCGAFVAAAVAAHFVSRFIASFVGSLWRRAQAWCWHEKKIQGKKPARLLNDYVPLSP